MTRRRRLAAVSLDPTKNHDVRTFARPPISRVRILALARLRRPRGRGGERAVAQLDAVSQSSVAHRRRARRLQRRRPLRLGHDSPGPGTNPSVMNLMLGDGAGLLLPPTAFPTLTPGGAGIVAGDWNGDSKLDVATVELNSPGPSGRVSIFLGDGAGGFQTVVEYPVGIQSRGVAAADFNGDGILDLATANSSATASSVTILLGDGLGIHVPQRNADGVEALVDRGRRPERRRNPPTSRPRTMATIRLESCSTMARGTSRWRPPPIRRAPARAGSRSAI